MTEEEFVLDRWWQVSSMTPPGRWMAWGRQENVRKTSFALTGDSADVSEIKSQCEKDNQLEKNELMEQAKQIS